MIKTGMTNLNLRNKKVRLSALVMLVVTFLPNCVKREPYYKFEQIKNAEWKQSDTLTYIIDSTVINPTKIYDISIEISNNNKYPYRNIWLYITSEKQPTDSLLDSIPKEYVLADGFGKWEGAGFGTLFQSTFSLQKNVKFCEGSNYKIKVIHAMQDEPLKGIENVGIKLSEH